MNEAESHITCPYNKAHTILKGRMQFHLARCRLQHTTSEMVSCPYNCVHVIPKIEMDLHEQICPDRNVLDSFVYEIGTNNCPASQTVPINELDLPPCEENWDDEGEGLSVLDVVKEKAKDKGVLLNLIGAPKAERKAHRLHERVRYQRVMDGHHEGLVKPLTSAGDTCSDGLSNQEVKNVRMPHGKGKKKELNKPNETAEKSKDSASSSVSNNSTNGNLDKPQDDCLSKTHSWALKSENHESIKPNNLVQTVSDSKQALSGPPINIRAGSGKTGNAWNVKVECNGLNLTENSGTTSALLKSNTSLTTNAWNQVVQNSGTVFSANSDFPMLPVSGRGRGRKRNGKF